MKCDVLVILCKHTNNFFHILDIPSIRKSNMLSVIRNKTCMCCIIVVTSGILFTFCIQNVIRMKESFALRFFWDRTVFYSKHSPKFMESCGENTFFSLTYSSESHSDEYISIGIVIAPLFCQYL